MSRYSQASGSLSGVEERIRRSLGEIGLLEASFKADAIPVVLIDDATRPGCNVNRGRHWQAAIDVTPVPAYGGGAWWCSLKASNAIIIDSVCAGNYDGAVNAPILMQISLLPAAATDPHAFATPAGSFTELLRSVTDRPPFLTTQNTATAFGGISIGEYVIPHWTYAGSTVCFPQHLHVSEGGKVGFHFNNQAPNTVSLVLIISGRVF